MTYQVIIEAPARADMEEAYRRLAADSPERAAQWYNGLVDAITSLTTLARRCAFAPENAFFPEEIRHLLYGKRTPRPSGSAQGFASYLNTTGWCWRKRSPVSINSLTASRNLSV